MAISNVPHRRKLHLEPPTSTSSLSTKESSALPSRLLTSPHAASPPSGAVSTSLEHSFDPTALLLIRRTLCAHRVSPTLPIAELLPRLTSSEAIDLELYAIISVVVRDFIATWYTKITLDGEFLDEIIELVAHISHALESRLATLDLERLLLDELPAVINGHIIGACAVSTKLYE